MAVRVSGSLVLLVFLLDTKCLMDCCLPFALRSSLVKLGLNLDSVLWLTHGVCWG